MIQREPLRIAILTKNAPFHNDVIKGLYKQMEHFPLYVECHLYTIDRGLSWKQAIVTMHEVIKKKPVLIVSVGALCSQAARHVLNETESTTPLLFAGVTLPDQLGLVPTKNTPHNTTGISLGFPSHTISSQVLHYLKPDSEHVLLPYSPHAESGTLTNAAHLVKEYLSKRNIKVTTLPLHNHEAMLEEIVQQIQNTDIDTLLTLEGCATGEVSLELAKLCLQKRIVYFSSDVGTIEHGAAAGLVAVPSKIGNQVYSYIKQIIHDKKDITTLPIQFLGNSGRKIIVNQTAVEQGLLRLSFEQEYFLRHGKVVGANPLFSRVENE